VKIETAGQHCAIRRVYGFTDVLGLLVGTEYEHDRVSKAVVESAMRNSNEAWVATCNGETACIWGLTPRDMTADEAYIWSLTTDVVRKYPVLFLHCTKDAMTEMLKRYSRLVGLCEDERSKKWLKLFGATFGSTYLGYQAFEIRRK